MDSTWFTPPVAVALAFVAVSTIAQIAGFGGLLIWQRINFERRIAALDVKHQAERKADKILFRRENARLSNTVDTLTSIIRQIKPDADIPLTATFNAVRAESMKTLREFLRRHYSLDEFTVLISDFGLNPDEFQNETTIGRMDRFINALAHRGLLDELRERMVQDRPEAAALEEI